MKTVSRLSYTRIDNSRCCDTTYEFIEIYHLCYKFYFDLIKTEVAKEDRVSEISVHGHAQSRTRRKSLPRFVQHEAELSHNKHAIFRVIHVYAYH